MQPFSNDSNLLDMCGGIFEKFLLTEMLNSHNYSSLITFCYCNLLLHLIMQVLRIFNYMVSYSQKQGLVYSFTIFMLKVIR